MADQIQEELLTSIAANRVSPFYFDNDRLAFCVDDTRILLEPRWEQVAREALASTEPLRSDQLLEHPLVFGSITKVYGLPKMAEYVSKLSDQQQQQLGAKTERVMKVVHTCLSLVTGEKPISNLSAFSVRWYRGAPDLAIGFHTSIGPSASSYCGEHGQPYGIYEFTTNNEDWIIDRAALFAGLGYIAGQAI